MFIANFRVRSGIRSFLSIVHEIVTYASFHPYVELKKRCLKETADYITQSMPEAVSTHGTQAIMDIALNAVRGTGYYLEFGVYKGGSVTYIAKKTGKLVHGFDSFEGLDMDWAGTQNKKRDFDLARHLPKVPGNVQLHAGWFKDSLPSWLHQNPGRVSFLHIDCDIYSSTKTIFDLVGERIESGTIILFDEYFNYPNWRNHEFKAFQEFIQQTNKSYKYLAYSNFQVAVQIL